MNPYIQMLRSVANGALQMGAALTARVDDLEEKLAKQDGSVAGVKAAVAAAFAQAGQECPAPQEGERAAASAPVAAPSSAEPPAAQPSEPQLTIVELRAFVAEKSTPENRPAIKEILTQHGVKKLTELKPGQYPSVMAAVRKACGA